MDVDRNSGTDTEPKGVDSNKNDIVSTNSISYTIETPVNHSKDASADQSTTTKRDASVRLRMTEGLGQRSPESVVTLLQSTVDKIPNNAALCVKRNGEWKRWTYREYYDDACRVAKSFIKIGLQPYYCVGILGFNSPEWFLADIGAIFAGGIAVGIYTTNTPEACQFIASDSKAVVIVVENTTYLKKILQFKDKLPDLKAIVQYTGEIEEPQPNLYTWKEFMKLGEDVPDSTLQERFQGLAPNKCCTLIYTSGTTGNPKGVMLSHDNMVWTQFSSASCLKYVYGRERIVSYLPLSHSAAQVSELYFPLISGGTVYFAQPDALKGSLLSTIQEVRPTLFLGVPRVWEKIMEGMKEVGRSTKGLKLKIITWAKDIGLRGNMSRMNGGDVPFGWFLANTLVFKSVKSKLGLDQCMNMFNGAAPLSKETLEFFMSLDIMIDEGYGLTECTGPHIIGREGARRYLSVGKPMTGLQIKIANPDEEGCGEICMYGRNTFMGYLEKEEKTKEAFDDENWFMSGDIGKIDKDGFVFITGRIKEIIITAGGENVAPIAIEDSVKEALPVVSNCMLIGDKRKFLSLLITIKCEVNTDTMEPLDELNSTAIHWCRNVRCNATTVSELIKDENVKNAIQDGINNANKHAVSRAAIIQKWLIVGKDFSIPGGELGPTLKLKRHAVLKKYNQEIDAFYE